LEFSLSYDADCDIAHTFLILVGNEYMEELLLLNIN